MAPYRLETLLGLRKRAEEAAKQEFAEAQRALAAARAELKRLEQDLERRKSEREAKMDACLREMVEKGTATRPVLLKDAYEKRLRREEEEVAELIEEQKAVVFEAEVVADQKREALAEAAKKLKALEKHKEKFLKRQKAEFDAREELAGEEIGSALHLARQRSALRQP